MKQLLLLFIFFISFPAWACLNGESLVLKNNFIVYEDYQGVVPSGHIFYTKHYPSIYAELDSLYKATKDIDYLSDKGYLLIVEGKYEEAIELYLKIEKKYPGRYSTASNIGTAYELNGQYQKAWNWIEKAVRINPNAHSKSEWIHINILKAETHAETPRSIDLIGVDFGNRVAPMTLLSKERLLDLQSALYYQLQERMSFIKPKNEIIAKLLFELGNIDMLLNDPLAAKLTYDLALDYGFSDSIIKLRIEKPKKIIIAQNQAERKAEAQYKQRQTIISYAIITAALLLLIGVVILVWRIIKKTRNKS